MSANDGPAPQPPPGDDPPQDSPHDPPQSAPQTPELQDDGAATRLGDGLVEQDARERELRREGLYRLYPGGVGAAAFADGTAVNNQFNVQGGRTYHADGDIHIVSGDAPERPQAIVFTEKGLARLAPDYVVRTHSLEALVDGLQQGRVRAVCGPPGTGRATTALAALTLFAEQVTPRGRVARLPDGLDPRRLRDIDIKGGTGYLIDASDAEWTRTRNDSVFRQAADLADRTKSAFVILVTDRAHLTEDQRAEYVVTHAAPAAIEVFERCLSFELRDRGVSEAGEMARKLAGHEAARGALGAGARPRDAYALALSLSRNLRDGREPQDVLVEVVNERPQRIRERAEAQLAEKELDGSPIEFTYRRSFLIAAAVLDGNSMVKVTSAAVSLVQDVYTVRTNAPVPESTWSAFDETLTSWLEYADADRDLREEEPGPVIRLRTPGRAAAILDVAWHNHPTLREPMMEWLDRLTRDPDPRIQVAAAQAIGKLATYDYDAISGRFLEGWVGERLVAGHRLAAWALEAAAQEPGFVERVRHLLFTWARGSVVERSVAVRAYATSLGRLLLPDTLLDLRRIAASSGIALRREAARAFAELLFDGLEDGIVAELVSWTRSDSAGLKRAAAEALFRLAFVTSEDLPGLLAALAQGEESRQAQIAELWRNALLDSDIGGVTWHVLENWIQRAEADPRLLAQIAGLVARLGAERRLVPPLRFYLTWWRGRTVSVRTAALLLAHVERRSRR